MGARTVCDTALQAGLAFQSTRPWGREPECIPSLHSSTVFQSTRPWGRERLRQASGMDGSCVSIHAPVGARTIIWIDADAVCMRFNPRARGGANAADWIQRCVSSARGTCFNPRARGGANEHCCRVLAHVSSFNPRARGGANDSLKLAHTVDVSIHAPVGARTCDRTDSSPCRCTCFNPRARGGANCSTVSHIEIRGLEGFLRASRGKEGRVKPDLGRGMPETFAIQELRMIADLAAK